MHLNTTTSARCELKDFLANLTKFDREYDSRIERTLTGHSQPAKYVLWGIHQPSNFLNEWIEDSGSPIFRVECVHSSLYLRLSSLGADLGQFLVDLAAFVTSHKIDRLEIAFQWGRKTNRALRVDLVDQGEDGKILALSLAS